MGVPITGGLGARGRFWTAFGEESAGYGLKRCCILHGLVVFRAYGLRWGEPQAFVEMAHEPLAAPILPNLDHDRGVPGVGLPLNHQPRRKADV